jgi:tetratricopeptide (TPR) repeat protein
LAKARQLIETHKAPEYGPTVQRWTAQVALTAGDIQQAADVLEAALNEAPQDLGLEFEPLQWLWGQTLAAQGKQPEAVQVLEASLARLASENEAGYDMACALLTLARILAREEVGREEALTYAARAHAIFADLGASLDRQEASALIASIEPC